MAKVYDEKATAVRVIAHLEDFDGDVNDWKINFYELWRYQMTWGFAFEISVGESRQNGVFVDLLVKKPYKKNILETMQELGYRNITHYDETVGIVYGYEHEDLDNIWYLYLDN